MGTRIDNILKGVNPENCIGFSAFAKCLVNKVVVLQARTKMLVKPSVY